MYYLSRNNLGSLGQTSCAQIAAHLEKAKFLASPAGGRSKKHQKEHAASAKKLEKQLSECELSQNQEAQNFNLQVQQKVAPAPTSASRFWILVGIVGVLGIVGFTTYKLKKRRG